MRKIKNKILILRRDKDKLNEKEINQKKKEIILLLNNYNNLKNFCISDLKSQN